MKLYNRLTFLISIGFILSGCGPLHPSTPQPVATEETLPQPPAIPIPSDVAPTGPGQSGNAWVEYRDARYGYAIALPCYWSFTATPMEGMFAAMTARSYSDEFFAANSERGDWKNNIWPAGALKLDIIVIEGVDPALSLTDAVKQFYAEYSTEQEISSLEEVAIGTHSGLLATMTGGLSGAESVRIAYFRLAPDKLMSFLFYPDIALATPDAQAILNSLVLPAEGEIMLPTVDPSGRPDDGSLSCS